VPKLSNVKLSEDTSPNTPWSSHPREQVEPIELDEAAVRKLIGKIYLCDCGDYHPVQLESVSKLKPIVEGKSQARPGSENNRGMHRVFNADKPW